jgi:hypothetical protein
MCRSWLARIAAGMLALGLWATVSTVRAKDDDSAALKAAGIPTDGPGLVAFFKQQSLTLSDEARIKALVRQLGDDEFKKREQASRQLILLGSRARTFLQAAVKDPDPEIARRAQDCLDRLARGVSATALAAAARELARLHPPQAAAALIEYLPAADNETVIEAIQRALPSLAVRDGKTDPALVAALSDKFPLKRSVAAAALCSAHSPDAMPSVRKLLQDRDPHVRLRVGMALAAGREKDAVPVLIRLLDELPWSDLEPLMYFLERLAGENMPATVYGTDADARRKYRVAWEAWWKERSGKLEPASLERASRMLGFTTVVLLDEGVIEDLDADNRPRWKIDNLSKPLDAQLLPGDERILVAEHSANRVSERDVKGKIVWKHSVIGPLAAQRLSNGNTFITTTQELMEIDKNGKEVFRYSRPDGGAFMRATKLRDGDIACIAQIGGASRYYRLTPADKEFKEVKNWGVQVNTLGGRVEVLPNGHVLIPEMYNNRVVEFDADGHVVWETAIDQPIAAMRLPNGHTIVTLMRENRAVELDRSGKELWQFKAETRVTRAYRR